jgi:hypothetical protein
MKISPKFSALFLLFAFMCGFANTVMAATTVNLGTASSFSVLAYSGITNTGATTISGNVGSHPTGSFTGFGTVTLGGIDHSNDSVTLGAKSDLTTAYNNAAGQTPNSTFLAGENQLGGLTLTPGVYAFGHATTANLIGTLTLNGEGNPNAVFIFQASSDLVTSSESSVSFINQAQPCNVFWQVASSTTLGSGSNFAGTVMSMDSITVDSNVTINGRLLAQNGTVTLIADTINITVCNLANTGIVSPVNQDIPWAIIIISLAGLSTFSLVYTFAIRKEKIA